MSVESAVLDLSRRVRLAGVRLDKPQRDAMNVALVNVLHEARIGPVKASDLTPHQAIELFREVTRLAMSVKADRGQMVLIFNGEEDAAEAVRRDLE